jgi:hypothetical protein
VDVRRFFASVGLHTSDERAEGKVRAAVDPGGPPTALPRGQVGPRCLLATVSHCRATA